jgi:hypothetical protein
VKALGALVARGLKTNAPSGLAAQTLHSIPKDSADESRSYSWVHGVTSMMSSAFLSGGPSCSRSLPPGPWVTDVPGATTAGSQRAVLAR